MRSIIFDTREVGILAVIREFIFIQGRFIPERWYDRFFKSVMEISGESERLTMLVIGTKSAEHSLRSQVGIESESHCLLGQLNKILEISEAGLKVEKSGSVLEKKVNEEMLR